MPDSNSPENGIANEPEATLWHEASSWDVYKRLLGYSLEYWQRFALAVLGMVAYAAAHGSFMFVFQRLLDDGFVERDPTAVTWIPVAIVVLFVVRGSGTFLSTYFMTSVAHRVIRKMRNEVFAHMLIMPTSYFESTSSGKLLAKLTYHVEQVAGAATNAVTVIIRDGLTVIALLGAMLYFSWQLSLFVLLTSPVIALLIAYVAKRFRKYAERIQEAVGDVTSVAAESIDAQREIKAFGGQGIANKSFRLVTARALILNMKVALVQGLNGPIVQFIASLSIAMVISFAMAPEAAGQMTAGTFTGFLGAAASLLTPIKHLTNVNVELQRGIAAAGSVFKTLELSPEQDLGNIELDRAKGQVKFENVTFAYPNAERKALSNINLEIKAGQTVAFVGQTGSGKTTLVSMLPRFYDIDSGSITLDGNDIRDIKLGNLRNQLAVVGQHVTLFNQTIRNNIAYGQADEISDEKVVAAAKASNCWDFIKDLPQGLNTDVGENGVMLSGGQRQRLAIARALLKDAPILILDEATSALDTETERKIQDALENLMSNRTTLVVAHRLSTIENADIIVVMEKGEILEAGSHAELLEQDGHYAHLHRLQFSEQSS